MVIFLHLCQEGPLRLNMGTGHYQGPACTGIVFAKCEGTIAGLEESTNLVESLEQVETHLKIF